MIDDLRMTHKEWLGDRFPGRSKKSDLEAPDQEIMFIRMELITISTIKQLQRARPG